MSAADPTSFDLEVLSARPKEGLAAHPTPLLFVHGAYSSARQWAPFFLPYFASHGWTAKAVSVRGHGASSGRDSIKTTRLADYIADVRAVAAGLSQPPVLVGHSMGGMIVQKILAAGDTVPAAVLMCSAPPHGLFASALSAAFANPAMFQGLARMQREGPAAASFRAAKKALFREDTPDDWIANVMPPAEPESDAVMMDMTFRDLPPSRGRRDVPVLVLGAERDTCITATSVRETGRAFGVEPVVFKGFPHAMMLDPAWEEVAGHMRGWLESVLPAS